MADPFDIRFLGRDLATSSSGDLATFQGDFDSISGEDNVIGAFVRELMTPLGHIGRWVYDTEGLKALDEDYGNEGYFQLSEPMTADWISKMVEAIKSVADSQSRIVVDGIDYQIMGTEQTRIRFVIRFRITGVVKSFNMVLVTNGSTFSADVTEV